jgi:hypothetical protein
LRYIKREKNLRTWNDARQSVQTLGAAQCDGSMTKLVRRHKLLADFPKSLPGAPATPCATATDRQDYEEAEAEIKGASDVVRETPKDQDRKVAIQFRHR